jgi:acyl-CoA thioester hydrolase
MEIETTVQIRWRDMDAMRHVNNATYLTYLETAREPWFERFVPGLDSMAFALRRIEIDYLSQLTFDDGEVRISVALEGVGTSSITTSERIVARDGRVVAEARAVHVKLDETGLRSAPLDPGLREQLVRGS